MSKSNSKKTVSKKKKLPRWIVITAVVALVLVAVLAIFAAPFLTVKSSKDATVFIKRGSSNEVVCDSLAKAIDKDFADNSQSRKVRAHSALPIICAVVQPMR